MVAVLDETQKDIAALVKRDLGPQISLQDFGEAVRSWVHYLARRIPQRPRKVIFSSQLSAISKDYPAIEQIADEFRSGADLSPRLSDGIRLKRSDPLADLMFNDWQIHHFHLGQLFQTRTKTTRTRNLLFAYVSADEAVLLDVLPHGSWTSQKILEAFSDAAPHIFDRFELKGIVGLERKITSDEMYLLRKSGINSAFELGGRYYIAPGLGISSSGHATRLVRFVDQFFLMIENAKNQIQSNAVPQPLMRVLAGSLPMPVLLGVHYRAGQLVLVDKNRNIDLWAMRVLE